MPISESKIHDSVLANEIVEIFAHLNHQACVIDATLGTGGHSLKLIKSGINILGIEADEDILEIARQRILKACPTAIADKNCSSYILVHNNFRNISQIAEVNSWKKVDGVIFDLGVTNLHLKDKTRGFSFSNPDADLDMRVDKKNQNIKASDLLNLLREDQLTDMFSVVLDKSQAEYLSGKVIQYRETEKITKVGDLLQILEGVRHKNTLHYATLPFLALRIAVNSELDNLQIALPKAFDLLEKGGRLAVITFHSAEDRIVKDFFEEVLKQKTARLYKKEIIQPTKKEIIENPRARSAKLRIIDKI